MARRISLVTCMSCCWLGLIGCSEKKNMQMDMSAMQPPARPAELDMLNSWVGTWTSTGEMKSGDKVMNSTGTSTISWELDNRVLVERATGTIPEMGTHHALIVF